jgi:hypothetical protein
MPAMSAREEYGSTTSPGDVPAIHEDAETKTEREITCARCGGGVTRARARMSVNGAHVHTFKNPSAIDYTIACFDEANGCVGSGEQSSVWTRFPGYAWQVALCAHCGEHLGWSFDRHSERFWALILDRLRE